MAFMVDQEVARAAFSTASEQARNAVKNLFSSYGFTRQGTDGQWSTGAAGGAFDPSNFVSMNPATGQVNIDTEAVGRLSRGEFGTGFGYNKLTDVIGGAASREALAQSALRGRGIRSGGLVRQAGSTAEAQQGRDIGTLAGEFIGSLGNIYGNIGSAVTSAVESNIENLGTGAQTIAESTPVVSTPPAASATGPEAKPSTPGNRMYALSARGGWRWMGSKGWKKVNT